MEKTRELRKIKCGKCGKVSSTDQFEPSGDKFLITGRTYESSYLNCTCDRETALAFDPGDGSEITLNSPAEFID